MPKGPFDRLRPMTSQGHLNVVVETPYGSQNKYKYDEKLGIFRLNRVLFSGAVFPFDFGFIAGTRGGDGDPLDAISLVSAPTFPGCVVRSRAIGVLLATKGGKENHRIVTVPLVGKTLASVRDIADLHVGKLGEIEQFFRAILNVDGLEHALLGFGGREEAERIIVKSARRGVLPKARAKPVKQKRAGASLPPPPARRAAGKRKRLAARAGPTIADRRSALARQLRGHDVPPGLARRGARARLRTLSLTRQGALLRRVQPAAGPAP